MKPAPLVLLATLSAAALAACASARQAPAAPPPPAPDPQTLIAQWQEQNTLCRGLHGDDPRMQPACDERQRIGHALYQRGWCYGEEGEMGYQMQWRRCHADSAPYEEH
ncbi:MAG: hypothetical protein QM761_03325 [Pseudoxanthomonas sp.]